MILDNALLGRRVLLIPDRLYLSRAQIKGPTVAGTPPALTLPALPFGPIRGVGRRDVVRLTARRVVQRDKPELPTPFGGEAPEGRPLQGEGGRRTDLGAAVALDPEDLAGEIEDLPQ